MRKNVGSQVVGAQMVTAADGTAFTGTVTCYVTTDGGTQALGGTASGVCTHEGNGFHTYVPTQAETNGDHVAFTFIGTAAVPATVQVYPRIATLVEEQNAARGSAALVTGACESGSTTTNIVTDLAEPTNRHYNGRVITFTTRALAGQTKNITAYNGTTRALTVTAFTEAPANTDQFVIS